MPYFIGIDGGGTKTRAVLCDRNGYVYADVTSGPSNLNSMRESDLKETFQQLFEGLDNQAPASLYEVTKVFAGIAGGSNQSNAQTIRLLMKRYVPRSTSVYLDIDAVNALYSGTYGKPGIVQIAGTGSISYGLNAKNQRARVGGWGYLLGDEGSGYFIGKQGIASSLRAYDGREKTTVLHYKVFDHFQVETGESLIESIYNEDSPKSIIASAAKLVFDAYKENDSAAERIIIESTREMIHNILTLHHRLFQDDQQVKAVLCGGIFSDQSIIPHLMKTSNQFLETIEIISPSVPPVAGSIIGALLMDGSHVSEEFIKRLTMYFKKQQEER